MQLCKLTFFRIFIIWSSCVYIGEGPLKWKCRELLSSSLTCLVSINKWSLHCLDSSLALRVFFPFSWSVSSAVIIWVGYQWGLMGDTSMMYIHNIHNVRKNSSALHRLISQAMKIFSEKANKLQGLQLLVPQPGLLKGICLVSSNFWVHKLLHLCKISLQHNKALSGRSQEAGSRLHSIRKYTGNINFTVKMWRSLDKVFNRIIKSWVPFTVDRNVGFGSQKSSGRVHGGVKGLIYTYTHTFLHHFA